MARKSVIITCAITGSLHTPSMSPYLPITPDEIVAESVAAAEAGAAIIHLHARDPRDGRPSADPDLFMQFLPRIKQQTGAVLNITTGARFTTYAIEAPRGSKVVGVNGAAARLVQAGDKVIVVTYCQMDAAEARNYAPVVVLRVAPVPSFTMDT